MEHKRGMIKTWNNDKGYGFVVPVDERGRKIGPDIFAHYNAGKFVELNIGQVKSAQVGEIVYTETGVRNVDGGTEQIRVPQQGDFVIYLEGKDREDRAKVFQWTYEGVWKDFEQELDARPLFRVVCRATASTDDDEFDVDWGGEDAGSNGRDPFELSASYPVYSLNGTLYDALVSDDPAVFYTIEAYDPADEVWYECSDPRVELCCVPPAYRDKFTRTHVKVPNYCPHGTRHPLLMRERRSHRGGPRKGAGQKARSES